jgi:molybdopterin-binding protein
VRAAGELPGGAVRLRAAAGEGQEVELIGPALPFDPGSTPFFATIAPTQVILAREGVANVSMRNQVPGTVRDVVAHGDEVLCVVDAGVTILAEVTPASRERLGLEKGTAVHCLFKAHALTYSR